VVEDSKIAFCGSVGKIIDLLTYMVRPLLDCLKDCRAIGLFSKIYSTTINERLTYNPRNMSAEESQEDFDIRVNKINLVNIILLDDFVINKSSNIFTVVEKTLLNKVLNFANRIKSGPKCKVITSIESGIQIQYNTTLGC
jgi:hypothetical protein